MSDRVKLILGPPGTGKTTSLLDIMGESLAAGVPSHRIAVTTFTRKASEEVTERACEKFKLHKKSLPNVTTLHAMSYRRLEISRSEVMQTAHFRTFGMKIGGFEFKNDYDENIERPPASGAMGDLCLRLYALHKSTGKPRLDIWTDFGRNEVAWQDYDFFCDALEKFKRQHGLYDFTDFMSVDPKPLDCQVFIIDEAQDLTTQQWNYARKVAKNAEKVYIAGDDDQAIFQWAGADLEQLFRISGERRVLPHSYRLPISIYNVACSLTDLIPHRFEKEWTPRQEQGSVNYLSSAEDVDLSKGTWYLLGRNRSELMAYERIVRSQGYAYSLMGKDSTKDDRIKAVLAYETMRKGESVSAADARLAARLVTNALAPDTNGLVRWGDMKWHFGSEKPLWTRGMDKLDEWTRDYIRAMLMRKESLRKEPRISINTIHSVKGGEKENVVINCDMGGKTYASYLENPAEEIRVWYVAVTRASQNLFLIMPKTRRYIEALIH